MSKRDKERQEQATEEAQVAKGADSYEAALAQAREERKATDAAKPKKAHKAKEKTHACLCGCGGLSSGRWCAGHDGRVVGWFVALSKGKEKPEVSDNPTLRSVFVAWASNGKGNSLKAAVAQAQA